MRNKKIAIVGFGIEGKDAYRYFSNRNNDVFIFDKNEWEGLNFDGINIDKEKIKTGQSYLAEGLSTFDLIIRSAGVRPDLPELSEARKRGIKITSTINHFIGKYDGNIIGVTGTKGKGTTSTLIYEILKKAGVNIALAGNIGVPVLDILDSDKQPDWCVLELSSFQLMDIEYSPNISVVLNITLDHMDWHKNKEEYYKAKHNIVRFQNENDHAILNFDYENSRKYDKLTDSNIYYFSTREKVQGSYVIEGNIFLNIDKVQMIGNTNDLILRGEHNYENICAAVTASSLAGASLEAIRSVVFSFKGLEHRLEFVREINEIKYYNDSFSTTTHTTLAAINSFTEDVTLILGGYDKGLEYKELVDNSVGISNLKNIILIGDIGKQYEKWYQESGFSHELIYMDHRNMGEIVKKAHEITNPGGVVLLSPSTSSFDMFEDYKKRGLAFKDAVSKL